MSDMKKSIISKKNDLSVLIYSIWPWTMSFILMI